jgi:hypothetical protein
MPQVKVSMEDRESVDRVPTLWGRQTCFCLGSSVGNDVWSAQIGGQKAKEQLGLVMPYLAGVKRKKALQLISKSERATTLGVKDRGSFKPFEGML